MSTLEELGLEGDRTEIEIPDEVPEETGTYVPLVRPGTYIFKLPDDLGSVWTKFDVADKGTRVGAAFNRDNLLIVVSEGDHENSPVNTFITNRERARRDGAEVADMFYLIKALEADLDEVEQTKLTTNGAFMRALEKQGGRMFQAQIHWEAYCHPGKNIWMTELDESDPENPRKRAIEQPGVLGCKSSYNSYTRDKTKQIPTDENGLMERFDEILVSGRTPEMCNAVLSSQIRLSRFAAVDQ